MFPSTLRTATIGGFVGGGSSGIGSVAFGMLSDRGSILGARVVTLEDEPQVIDLRSAEVNQVHHAYGTNGIITEVTIPLARAQPWVELAVAFDTLAALVRFCRDVAETSGIVTRLIAAHDAEVCGYLGKFPVPLPPGKAVGLLIVARQSLEPLNAWLTEQGGSIVYDRSEAQAAAAQAVPIYEFAWNHTTLHALRADRNVTYLQTLFPAPLDLDLVGAMAERFGDEVPMHLEFVRLGGHVACFGLQLVRYTTAERLDEIMAAYDAAGCPNFNPHTFVLEDGGMRQTDPVQLAFKQRTDPYGLMNPGKMRGWTPAGSVRA